MTTWNTYSWQGTPAAVTAALGNDGADGNPKTGLRALNIDPTILGPVVSGGVSYIRVRSQGVLSVPAGLSGIDDATAEIKCGVWLGDIPAV
jgi:hypothetical protein